MAVVAVDLNRAFDPAAGRIYYPAPLPDAAVDAARVTLPFEVFGRFSQLPFWKVGPLPEGSIVRADRPSLQNTPIVLDSKRKRLWIHRAT